MTEVKITVSDEFERKHSKGLYLRLLFHIVACSVFFFVQCYGVYMLFVKFNDEEVTDPQLLTLKWYTPGYLTNWNFLFQTTFLTLSLVYDMMEWLERHDSSFGRKLKTFRDILFSGLVVPMTLFVSTMFWTVFWIDRELVFPQVYDQLVPWWFNHCVHTNISIVVLIETILQARRHPTNMKVELWLNGTAGVLYAIVYYSIYFFAGRWLYAVFGIMTWWQVCLYQIVIWASTYVFYFIQFPINRLFHKEELTEKEQTQETKNGLHNKAQIDSNSDNYLKSRPKSHIESSRF